MDVLEAVHLRVFSQEIIFCVICATHRVLHFFTVSVGGEEVR